MKAKKIIDAKLSKPSADKTLLSEVASKLSNEMLFQDSVEKAKLYLKQTTFPSQKIV